MKPIFPALILFMTAAGAFGAEVTWAEHVAPLVYQNCVECHRPGEPAPFSVLTYDDTRRRVRTILAAVEDGYMPPWHAVGGDVPLKGERLLSEEQIALLRDWYEAKMPEGNPALQPAPPEFPGGWRLGEPDLVLEMEDVFELPAEGPDIYRNFVIRTGLKEEKWLKAIEFKPGSPSVVHHSLFYLDTTGTARKVDKKDPGPGFAEMPIGEGIGRALGGWVPGATPYPLPEGLSYQIPADSEIIISTHFHLSGKPEKERSRIGLYFGDEPSKRKFAAVQLPPAFGAFAGVHLEPGKETVLTDTIQLPVAVRAFGATAHAHYLGKSLRLEAELPDGKELLLLNVPDWDFAWQEEYRFEEEVDLPAGTRLTSTVVWDNSEKNPHNPVLPPAKVYWGRQSSDEMGSMILMVTTDTAEKSKKLHRALSEHLQWQAGSHLISSDKLSFAASLRERALKQFDKDGDGVLSPREKTRAREFLKRDES